MPLATVFISSTSLDLADYRAAVRRACDELGLGVVDMKDFEAADLNAVRASLAKLDQAAVYVGVFAYRFGHVLPGDERSVTEHEFDHATRRGIERLCFLVDQNFPWPEERKQHDQLDRVRVLHAKIRNAGLGVDTFTTPDNLNHSVFLALQRWLGRRGLLGPRQVPPPVTDFIGRQEQLRTLQDHCARGATISGVRGQGGIGKTELARKLVALIGERYRDGHVSLDLRGFHASLPPLSRRAVIEHVIRAFVGLDQRLPDEDAALEGLYHSVLAGKRVLLLLDNAAGPEQLEGLTPPPGCLLLVTSRRRFRLDGLAAVDLDTLPPEEAEALLRSLAGRLSEPEAAEIARLCGWLPKALRLAGAYLAERAHLNAAKYLERLRAARLAERTGLSEVATLVRLSEEALPKPVRAAWRELAVLVSGFEVGWAGAIWGVDADVAEDRVDALHRLSLLDWDGEAECFRLHDLVREYAAAALDDAARVRAERRHADCFLAEIGDAVALYKRGGVRIGEALRRFDRAWPEAQAAFARAQLRTDDDAAQRLCVGLLDRAAYLLHLRQHPSERVEWSTAAVAAARRLGDHRGEGTALGDLGMAYAALGQLQHAIEQYEQQLAIAREVGDRRGECQALGNLGLAYEALGKSECAIEQYEQRLAIAREVGEHQGEHIACWNLGQLLEKLGRLAEAIPLLEFCVAFLRDIGHPDADKRAAYVEAIRHRLTGAASEEPAP